MTRTPVLVVALALIAVAMPARAENPEPPKATMEQGEIARSAPLAYQTSGLPIPRYVSLRAGRDKVFVRSGPALRYPIKWVYQKERLPVEVIQEFDTWRKIRDFEGDEGWIHQSLLSGQRTVLVRAEELVPLQKDGGMQGHLVAKLEPNVIADVTRCKQALCEVSAGGFTGWADRKFLWGIYDSEELE